MATEIDEIDPLLDVLTQRWWAPVVRGAAALLFGVLCFVRPGASLSALVLVWGAYAVVDGIFNIILSVRRGAAGASWGSFLLEGLVSIAAGVVTFFWPALTALTLLYVIAAWAVVTGVLEIVAAVQLRRVMEHEWMLGASGVLSIAFGVLLLLRPGAGALAVTAIIGGYAVVFGALLIGLGIQLYRLRHPHGPITRARTA